MRVRDVGVEDVDAYVNEKIDDAELSEKTVSNHVTLLGTMLRTATTFKVPVAERGSAIPEAEGRTLRAGLSKDPAIGSNGGPYRARCGHAWARNSSASDESHPGP
jgi:hypothetical protein